MNSAPTQPANKLHIAWWVRRACEDRQSFLLAVTAGLGSGKTHGAVQWLLDRVALNRKAQFFGYSMPIYELIHNTAIPKTRKVLDALGYEVGRDYEIIRSPFPRCIFTKTKQEIHYVSGNRPDKIKSVEYGSAVVDEPGTTPKESVDRIKERVRDAAAERLQILLPGTPEGINHYSDEFDSDKQEGWDRSRPRDHALCRVAEDGSKVWIRRFRLTTYDNAQFLPPAYIPRLLDSYRDNPAYVQAYINGFFVPLITGNCYSNYKPAKHDIPNLDPSPYLPVYLTMDFNAHPLAWVSNQEFAREENGERNKYMIALHNADMGAAQLEDAAVEFAAKHPVGSFGNTPIYLYGDSSGHAESHKTRDTDYEAMAHYLRQLGYARIEVRALRYNPLETLSVDALNRWFLKDYHRVCERCTNYKRSLIATRWRDGEKKIEKKPGEKHTHWSDSEKYLAYALQEDEMKRIITHN